MLLVNFQRFALGLSLLAISVTTSASGTESVLAHVQFGTQIASSRTNGIDSGTLIAQSPDGTILVAGYVDAFPTDTGGIPPKPVLSKFDRNGRLLWQRVYDRLGWSIIGVNASAANPSVLMWYPEPGRWHQLDPESKSYSDHGLIQLWSTKTEGALDLELMTLHHRVTAVNTAITDDGITLLLEERVNRDGKSYSSFRAHFYNWSGEKTRSNYGFEFPETYTVFSDHDGMLSKGTDRANNNEKFLLYQDFKTKKSFRVNIDDCIRCTFRTAHRSGDRLEILATRGGSLDVSRSAFLLTLKPEAEVISKRIELPELAQFNGLRLFETNSGELIISGTDYLAGMVLRLSASEREIKWVKRFRSGATKPDVHDIAELKDGRLAITGRGADSSAILIITDAEGEHLEAFGRCVSSGFTLATLRHRLNKELGIYFQVNRHRSQTRSGTPGSPGRNILPNDQCGDHGEFKIVRFAQQLLNTPIKVDQSKLSDKELIRIKGSDAETLNNKPYRYIPDHQFSGIPVMLVNLNEAEAVARELESNVLPYLKEIEENSESFFFSVGHTFTNGNSLAQATMRNAGIKEELAISPANFLIALRSLEQALSQLTDAEKRKIKRSVNQINIVAVLPREGETGRIDEHVIELPERNAPNYWKWLQASSQLYPHRIAVAQENLLERMNIVVTRPANARSDEYLAFLDLLFRKLLHLEKFAEKIELEFYGKSTQPPSLRINGKDSCTNHSSPGMNADYIAEQLEKIWNCDNKGLVKNASSQCASISAEACQ